VAVIDHGPVARRLGRDCVSQTGEGRAVLVCGFQPWGLVGCEWSVEYGFEWWRRRRRHRGL